MKTPRATSTMPVVSVAVLFALFLVLTTSAAAQSNEIALTVGGYFPLHVQARSNNVFAIQGNFAHCIRQVPAASLYVELPVIGSLSSPVSATTILRGQSFGTGTYSALFFAPGLRLELIPRSRISPFLAVGGGLAHFSKLNHNSPSTNTGVLDVGAGLDWKVSHRFRLRGEIRDLYSGAPELITGLNDREHQIAAAGGIVVSFGHRVLD